MNMRMYIPETEHRSTPPQLDKDVTIEEAEEEWFQVAMTSVNPWLIQAHRERFERIRACDLNGGGNS